MTLCRSLYVGKGLSKYEHEIFLIYFFNNFLNFYNIFSILSKFQRRLVNHERLINIKGVSTLVGLVYANFSSFIFFTCNVTSSS